METLIARCCGLDVHKAQVTACVRLLIDGAVTEIVQTFATTTPDLLALRDWLKSHAVTHVAMESTGVYCKCAARRPVVSPAQPGGTRRKVRGSDGLPGSER